MFWICQLGETHYLEAFELQEKLREKRVGREIPDLFLLTSHPAVYTLGKRPCEADFLSSKETIAQAGIEIIQSNRGGKITYHGPGQLVGYFIADIRSLKLSIPAFVDKIEGLLILTLKKWGLKAHRDKKYPGVWLGQKKIAALGLHFDRGVSMHGFSLNVGPNLAHYQHIVPCGIRGRSVTSLCEELHQKIAFSAVEESIIQQFSKILKGEIKTRNFLSKYSRFSDQ